ncbi:MAG: DUF2092 domain-containing protein [Kofleriaceae bacterium]|nr:DUF2092 domain-containing protein [Kofleriaceae bacterium]
MAEPQKPPPIDQRAISALCRMGAFLMAQENFAIRTTTETDYVTADGQLLRREAKGEIDAQRPNRLYAKVVGDRKEREFFYDGNTFTVFSPKLGYYSRVEAPPTIGKLADELELRFGLALPLVDLFRWGSAHPDFSDIEAAKYVGPSTIDGVLTDQYAFRQEGVDWQIWIQRGAQPLPRKLVLTTTDDPSRPAHEINMSWQLDTHTDASRFAFVPPKGSHQIAIAEIGTPTQSARR